MTLAATLKMTALALASAALLPGCAPMAPQAQAPAAATNVGTLQGKTQLLWLGQASFRITSPGGKTIVVDPWITGGTKTPQPYKGNLAALGKVDLLLVTHGTWTTSATRRRLRRCTTPSCTARPTW